MRLELVAAVNGESSAVMAAGVGTAKQAKQAKRFITQEESKGTGGRLGHGAGNDFAALYRGAATQAGDVSVAGHEAH